MGRKVLTEEEKKDSKLKNNCRNFIRNVRKFLCSKTNSKQVPPEWECSLMLLEQYYMQFLKLTEEIDKLPSLIVNSRYGAVPSPLLAARDKASVRLESMMKSLGITFKEAQRMETIVVEQEETDLEKFIKNKIEKR